MASYFVTLRLLYYMRERPRLLHVITGLNTGGAERALCNLLEGGLAERFDCAVLSLGDEGTMGQKIRGMGVPVYTLGMRSGLPTPSVLARLFKIVRCFRPDLVQGWMYHGNLAASLVTKLALGKPALVWNIRQSLYSLSGEKRLTRQVIRANCFLSRCPDSVIYNSKLSRTQHEAFGLEGESSYNIPNGFDLTRLGMNPEIRRTLRNELSIPEEALVVGHVARFHPMKDHASFLKASVEAAKMIPSSYFLLIGSGVSLENPSFKEIVSEEFRERFLFLGERGDVQELMKTMDVLALSSAWGEAFPNVIGEAMATGIPCVATDVGDSATIVSETGIIVPPSNSMELAQGMVDMLEKTATERKSLGEAARLRIERYYGLDAVISQYARLYDEYLPQAAGNS